MKRINWVRLSLGGLLAAIVLFVTDGLLHENVFKSYWEGLYTALGTQPPTSGHSLSLLYFFIFELGRGFGLMLIYALMRPFYGAGAKTAIFAAVIMWLAFSVTGPAQFIPLGLYSNALWLGVAGAQLVTSIIAALAAAALYKDHTGME